MEPASSSPSNANLMLDLVFRPAARIAVERGHQRHDVGLVVAGRARVDAGFRIELRSGQRNHAPVFFKRLVAQDWRKRRRGPFFGIERLAVVVGVENQRTGSAGSADLAEDYRVRAEDRYKLGGDSALFEHLRDEVGVALNVGAIGGDVGDREEGDELVDDGSFMLLPPFVGSLGGVFLRESSRGYEEDA